MDVLLWVLLSILAIAGTTAVTTTNDDAKIVPISRGPKRHHYAKRPISRGLMNLVSRNALSSVPLAFESIGAYVVDVTLSDGKSYTLQVDTGSSDSWIRGQYCGSLDPTDTSCNGRKVSINPLSRGLVDLKLSFFLVYGTGFVAGGVYKANLAVGGVSSTIAVGVSTIELQNQEIDGILGLGYSNLGQISSQITPLKGVSGNWFDASPFKNKQFGVYLSKVSNGAKGELTLGGYDTSRYTGSITWIPLIKRSVTPTGIPVQNVHGFFAFSIATWTWSVAANNAQQVPGGKGNLFTSASDPNGPTSVAIADTGSTFIIIATTPSDDIAAALNLAYDNYFQQYVLPCSNSYPPVNFHYGQTTFSIPSSVYTITYEKGVCVFGIVGGGDQVSIFGDVFTRAYYTMFDKANFRIGYALAK